MMGGSGGFSIDIVLFGMIAVFLILRLRSVLGRRTGFERAAVAPDRRTAAGSVIEGHAEPVAARAVPDPGSRLGLELARIHTVDRGFDPARFLGGAETAFRMIVGAYAAGDRATLRPLLGEDILGNFDQAITARETAGETQRSEIKTISAASIEEAHLRGSVASVTVRFVSEQVAQTLDRDGASVFGAEAPTEIIDIWTFERDLTHTSPNWRLVAAHFA